MCRYADNIALLTKGASRTGIGSFLELGLEARIGNKQCSLKLQHENKHQQNNVSGIQAYLIQQT